MNVPQVILFGLMASVLGLLLWGRLRHDVVAFGALVVAVILGVVPPDAAFRGFGHPATVIIALVLIASRGLSASGIVDLLTRHIVDPDRGVSRHVGVMSVLAGGLSAIMNNVAALALLLPVDLQAASRAKRSPGLTLMPLSFASILGGMVTLIGTPPNVVIATYRKSALGSPYEMFDFAPVGLIVAVVGVTYVAFVGWRLIPAGATRSNSVRELGHLAGYVAEARVPEGSRIIEKRLRDLDKAADEHDVAVLGLVRRGHRLPGTARNEPVRKGDHLVLEGAPQAMEDFIRATRLDLTTAQDQDGVLADALEMTEVVVPVGARIEGRSARDLRLLARHRVTLLGVSRRGRRFRDRVRRLPIKAGDLLLLVGPEDHLSDAVRWLGCLPVADKAVRVTQPRKALPAAALFMTGVLAAALGWLDLPIALAAVALLYVLLRIVPLSQVYDSIEWSVIVLLGSLIPIGEALQESGATELVASTIVAGTEGLPTVAVLVVLMVVTMTLSDVLNNVATALVAAPIGVATAQQLGVNPDAFLMGVAVAASCAFLTPIGHKNNIIIMGPGGYRFGDYWRVGLPLEILVLLVGVPAILVFWPL